MYTFSEKLRPVCIEITYLWCFFVKLNAFFDGSSRFKSNRVSHDKINMKKLFNTNNRWNEPVNIECQIMLR